MVLSLRSKRQTVLSFARAEEQSEAIIGLRVGKFATSCQSLEWLRAVWNVLDVEVQVANKRKLGFGSMVLPPCGGESFKPTVRSLVNMIIDSGLSAPESLKIKANGRFVAQGKRPYLKLNERFTSENDGSMKPSLVKCSSKFNLTQGQLSLEQTCSMCVDLALPCSPARSTRLLYIKPARMQVVAERSK